jgi:hypothetical protein
MELLGSYFPLIIFVLFIIGLLLVTEGLLIYLKLTTDLLINRVYNSGEMKRLLTYLFLVLGLFIPFRSTLGTTFEG